MGSSTVQVKEGSAEPTADPAAALRGGVELVWTALVEPSPEELAAAVAALGMPAALLEESRAGSPDVLRPGAPAHRRTGVGPGWWSSARAEGWCCCRPRTTTRTSRWASGC